MLIQLLIGFLASSLISGLAYQRHSLSISGVVAAILTGTLTYTAGASWAITLIAFFVSSTLLGRITNPKKVAARRQFSKGEQRDAWQVAANGGLATLVALVYIITSDDRLWIP